MDAAPRPRTSTPSARQPIHTVYGGAHLYSPETIPKLGRLARAALERYAGTPRRFVAALGLPKAGAPRLFARVCDKLAREPVEDYRLDFEDGFGIRPDAEEDATATGAAHALAEACRCNTQAPGLGIRIKSLAYDGGRRARRTLELFVSTLVEDLGRLPAGFVVTLPKIRGPEEVATLARALADLETSLSLPPHSLGLELMIELGQTLLAPDGSLALARLASAADGRCVAAHFGSYDYTASLGVSAIHQSLRHPACDFAKSLMQLAFLDTGIAVVDGATTLLPIAPNRPGPTGKLSAAAHKQNSAAVQAAWRAHVEDIEHGLRQGFYRGWDLHPAQLPSRYGAVYAFFFAALPSAGERLRHFVERAAQATRLGNRFDDAATGEGLLNFFRRGLACGALRDEDLSATGLTRAALERGSIGEIVASRSAPPGRSP